MKKQKTLWIIIAALVVLNIVCLLFIVSAGRRRPNQKFDSVLVESLNLNKQQVDQFNRLKHKHRMQMDQLDARMQQPFEHYFGLLTHNRNRQQEDSLKNALAELYKQKVDITYRHFIEIKAMCTAEQQQNISKMVPFLMQVISPPKKNAQGGGNR